MKSNIYSLSQVEITTFDEHSLVLTLPEAKTLQRVLTELFGNTSVGDEGKLVVINPGIRRIFKNFTSTPWVESPDDNTGHFLVNDKTTEITIDVLCGRE